MLKKSAGVVLASLRVSTYRSVRLASSLAAASLDRLFEHPAGYSGANTAREIAAAYCAKTELSAACQVACDVAMFARRGIVAWPMNGEKGRLPMK
jgi:hypothetical protein